MLNLFKAVNLDKPFVNRQAHNLKAELYKELLISLGSADNPVRHLHNCMEQVSVLYERGLYDQCHKLIFKTRVFAESYHQISFLFQLLAIEKKIYSIHTTIASDQDVKRMDDESRFIDNELRAINHYSLLSMLLRNHFEKWGSLAPFDPTVQCDLPVGGFYSKLYWYYCKMYLAKIATNNDTLWITEIINLFEANPLMMSLEQKQYQYAAKLYKRGPDTLPAELNDTPDSILIFYQQAALLFEKKEYNAALDLLILLVNAKLTNRYDLQIMSRKLFIACHKSLGNLEIIESLERSAQRFEKKIKYSLRNQE
jgi:hypothetical protein